MWPSWGRKKEKSTNLSYPRRWYSVATSQNSCPGGYTFFKLVSLPVPVWLARWIFMNYSSSVFCLHIEVGFPFSPQEWNPSFCLAPSVALISMAAKAAGEPLTHYCSKKSSKKKLSHRNTAEWYDYQLWLSTRLIISSCVAVSPSHCFQIFFLISFWAPGFPSRMKKKRKVLGNILYPETCLSPVIPELSSHSAMKKQGPSIQARHTSPYTLPCI